MATTGTLTPRGEDLVVFVPGPLHNPMNGSRGSWRKHARWAKQWRERTCERLRLTHLILPEEASIWRDPRKPKRIFFLAQTFNRFDSDGLSAALKPCRDALKDAGLIHDDGPDSGHRFDYAQVIDRASRGVSITVTAAP